MEAQSSGGDSLECLQSDDIYSLDEFGDRRGDSVPTLLCGHTHTKDRVLRSVEQAKAFQKSV